MISSVFLVFILRTMSVSAFNLPGDPSLQEKLRVRSVESCRLTGRDIEGPFYKRNSPIQRYSPAVVPKVCENSAANDRLILNGTIRQVAKGSPCGRNVRAVLDVWHANAAGEYSDIAASSPDFACRTRIVTDDNGAFTLSSIFPGRYDDNGGYRPAHVHFQITPIDTEDRATGKSLTTQMYFAHDHFLKPFDSCGFCGSGDPTLITHVSHIGDIKTFVGTWDVLLASSQEK